MIRNSRNIFYFGHLLLDTGLVVLTFAALTWTMGGKEFPDLTLFDLGFMLYLVTVWYFASRAHGLYADRVPVNLFREWVSTMKCLAVHTVLMVIFIFVFSNNQYSRGFVSVYVLALAALMPIGKVVLKQVFNWLYKKGILRRRTVVIGDGSTGERFYEYISNHRQYGYQAVRFIKDGLNLKSAATAALLYQKIGRYDEVDEVFIAESETGAYNTRTLANTLMSHYAARLRIIPNTFGSTAASPYRIGTLGEYPVLSLRNEPLEDPYNVLVKRVFDIAFSLMVLVFICSWLFPIIALAVKLDSRGPVFFRQERWGKRNRPFMCLKFRSMRAAAKDTDENGKFQQARKNDSRITKVGAFLRKTSLDEFPQFINVLLGDMSIVGPRPHATLMNKEAAEVVSNYLARHQAKPGITGWAQVNELRGESGDVELLKKRVEHDIWYIEHWSFLLDLKIVFRTVWNVLVGDDNAY